MTAALAAWLPFATLILIGATVVTVVLVATEAYERAHRDRLALLAMEACDWGEPTREQVEAGWLDAADATWLFPDPAFRETPIYGQLRHEADVLFAASVLADLDDLPTTGEETEARDGD